MTAHFLSGSQRASFTTLLLCFVHRKVGGIGWGLVTELQKWTTDETHLAKAIAIAEWEHLLNESQLLPSVSFLHLLFDITQPPSRRRVRDDSVHVSYFGAPPHGTQCLAGTKNLHKLKWLPILT
jgi:hypothetical protein